MRKVVPNDAVLPPDSARKMYTGSVFDIYQWQQPMFDGSERLFEMAKRADTVQTIAIVEGKIVLVDDEQPHVGVRTTLPGGRLDPDEVSVEAAARRETREETGYTFKNWRLIMVTQPLIKMEWFVHTFLAWDVDGHADSKLDGGEKISQKLVDMEELKRLINQEHIDFPEGRLLLRGAHNADDLLRLPQFTGKIVNR